MPSSPVNMRLRQWLITQIDSGKYPGLRWENREKTMFRIPWKHAAKQDYKQDADAALFKAWAVYKGKYQEGTDKADPSTWKTRLRCALNKSTDFQEVPERSQLDISEPYKVYMILPEGGKKPEKGSSPQRVVEYGHPRSLKQQHCYPDIPFNAEKRPPSIEIDGDCTETLNEASSYSVFPKNHNSYSAGLPPESVYQVKGVFCGWPSAPLQTPTVPMETEPPSSYYGTKDALYLPSLQLHIQLFYRDILVKEFTTSTSDGCRISHGFVPAENERIYGPSSMEQIQFPSPRIITDEASKSVAEAMERLLPHLDRGVLIWVVTDGVYIKRFCQGRVYWCGPLAPYTEQPNKLEREQTCKLFDTQKFLKELQTFMNHGGPKPRYEIDLCFGEEYPDPNTPKTRKLIMARIEPVFARDLFLYAQRLGPGSLHMLQQASSPSQNTLHNILKQLCQQ
ncbi:interferon regulatory factor 4-like [Protopterus annectens]|uniref:interferon regulatory factor 4-like n=1 Tax=Protopterus annectens TaxID=7888 RepID=UPI001CFAD83D|nr:interferon regulatory factor 4-like [Protopterus annectens]